MKQIFQSIFSSTPGRFFLIFCITSVVVGYFNQRFHAGDISALATWDRRLGYAIVPVILLSLLLASRRNTTIWQHVKRFSFWLGFLILLLLLYSYRSDLAHIKARLLAAVIPQMGFANRPGTMSFYRSSNGHFYVEALVNGQPVRFLVDTGASDIVIAPHIAQALGFNRENLDFSLIYHTANGQGRGAAIVLDTFQVGGLTVEKLTASVNSASMHDSLLGMRFFNRLQGFQIHKEILTIHWLQEKQEP